jgi:hypothetical protein
LDCRRTAYHSPNVLDTPHICNISWLRVNTAQPWACETAALVFKFDFRYASGENLRMMELWRSEILDVPTSIVFHVSICRSRVFCLFLTIFFKRVLVGLILFIIVILITKQNKYSKKYML